MNIEKKEYKTSEIFQLLSEKLSTEKTISIGDLIAYLEHRIYGLGILVFALPSIVPLSAIPGVAAFFSLPIILLSVQLIFLKEMPWLPKWLKQKTIHTKHLAKMLRYAIPYLQRAEKFIRPRYDFFNHSFVNILIGILLTWLGLLLILPIPLSNMIFGGLISLIAIGLIEKDGLVLCISLILGSITVGFYIRAFNLLLNWLF